MQLAEKHEVSERTVRNDLRTINELLKEIGIPILKRNRGGVIQVPENMSQILPHITSQDYYSYKLSKEERIMIASALMISATGYITLSAIADDLYVSRATIINDLPEIKEFVQNGGLEVVSQPNKGLMISGKESQKRWFIFQLSAFSMSEMGSKEALRMINTQSGNPILVQKILNEQLEVHGFRLVDSSFLKIQKYLCIMIDRVLKGEYIEKQEKHHWQRRELAFDIMRYLAQYISFVPTEDEVDYLASLLDQCRYHVHHVFNGDSIHLQMLTRQFIDAVSEELEVYLTNDYDFFESLSNHIHAMYSSNAAAFPDNEVIKEIVEDNPDVLAVVRNHLGIFAGYSERVLSEIEVAYIVVHVCAALERKKNREIIFRVILACHAGIGTSKLLLEKIKEHFNFKVVDIISAHEAVALDPSQADFVISTVALRNCPLEHVVVNPLMNDEDYVRVGNKIDALRNSKHLPDRIEEKEFTAGGVMERIIPILEKIVPKEAPELTREIRREVRRYFQEHQQVENVAADYLAPMLHQLLPVNHIQIDVECTDWKDAVRKSALPLLEAGYIEERYIRAMIANIEENGPYVVLSPGFAVPHEGLECGSVRVGMNMIRLKKPVNFDADEMDPIEFVCCLSAVDHKTHLKAFFNLVNMLLDPDFHQALHEAATPAEISAIIEKFEYSLQN